MAEDMLLALLLFIFVFALIVSEQIPRSVAAMLGAVLFISFGLVGIGIAWLGGQLIGSFYAIYDAIKFGMKDGK